MRLPLHKHEWNDDESEYGRDWQHCRCGWVRNHFHGHWEYYYFGHPVFMHKRVRSYVQWGLGVLAGGLLVWLL